MVHDMTAASAVDFFRQCLPNMSFESCEPPSVSTTDIKALFWLMESMRLEAVTNADWDAAQLKKAASSDAGWLAICNPYFSSYFHAHRPGAERA